MSYILEALRRAETERESRRRVPGLRAQPVPVLAGDEPQPPRSKNWLWVVLGVAAGLLLALLWRGSDHDPADEEAQAARAAAAGNVTSHAPAVVEPAPPASAVAEAPPPTPAATEAPAPAVAHERPPAHRKSSATAKAAPRPHAKAAEKAHEPTVATTAKPGAAPRQTAQTPAKASAPEPPLRTLADLPADVRSRVPPLSFGGSVYSEVPAQRLVILNGQVLREGDSIADDVWLEQVRPHSAVIRVRDQRFEYPF